VDEGYRKAREAAERALALEPDLAEAHATLGFIQMMFDWDWSGAEASYKRALELAPGNALALSAAAMLARNQCRYDEAIALGFRGLEQDPLSATAHTRFAACLASAGRLEEAETILRKSLELAPGGLLTRTWLARILLEQGHADDALAMLAGEPDEVYRLQNAAIINNKIGHTAEATAALNTMAEKYATDAAYQIAEVYGAFGQADAAFEWLERSYSQRDPGLTNIRASMDLQLLHDDPRWPVFLKKMGFEA
jgi:tetratricopeptide (TPR) repeat protein